MNTPQQAAPAAPAAPTEANGSGIVQSFEDRAAAAFGDDTGDTTATPGGQAAPASLDENATKRAERRKELDTVLAREAQRVDAHSQRRANEDAMRRAQAAERERDDLRQQLTGRIDPKSFAEPATFFELAQQHIKDPKALGAWLQKQANNPEIIAAEHAQRVIDPKLSALEQQNQALARQIEQLTNGINTDRATQQALARGDSMTTFTTANAAQAPYSARFLAKHGATEFLKLANSAYAGDVPGWEQHTLDTVEDQLSQLAEIYATPGAPPAKPSMTPQPNPGAAKPMTTVSNTLAQGRASVVDEETDWAALPYEERSRRLFG